MPTRPPRGRAPPLAKVPLYQGQFGTPPTAAPPAGQRSMRVSLNCDPVAKRVSGVSALAPRWYLLRPVPVAHGQCASEGPMGWD
jgi:hypothetical protein